MRWKLPIVFLAATLSIGRADVSHDFGGAYLVVQGGVLRGSFQEAEVIMPVPVSQPMQTITDLKVTPGDAEVFADADTGVSVAVLKIAGPATSGDMQISYSAQCHPLKFDLQELAAREYQPYDQDCELYRKYTAADRTIQSDDPSIVAVGEKLLAEYPNPFARARAAYYLVMQRCTYELSRAPTALEMFQTGVGNCTGYAKLFIAIARASGIPARRCSGAVVGQEPPWHLWAEFYLPDVGWVPCDPTNGDEAVDDPERYFGSLSAKPYIVFARGNGFELKSGEKARSFREISAGSSRWVGKLTADFTFDATRLSPVRYAILFQQTSQKRIVSADLDELALSREISQASAEGRRCVGIAVACRPSGLRYGAVWEQGNSAGGWAVHPKLTSGGIAQLLRTERDLGRMPISVASCVSDGGDEIYAAVFGPDKGAAWTASIGAPKEQFMTQMRSEMQNRRIPGSIAAHMRNGNPIISGVFAELRISAAITTGLWLQPDAFDERLEQYRADGYIPISIGATDDQPPYFHVVAIRTGVTMNWGIQRDLWGGQVPQVVEQAERAGLQPVSIVAY